MQSPGIIWIESIRLTDVYAVKALTIAPDAPVPEDDKGQWILLLGENGAGKTALLRAIALALVPRDVAAHAYRSLPSSPVRKGQDEARGVVRVGERDYQFVLHRDQAGELTIEQDPNGGVPRPPVFGYGCRRGSALGGTKAAAIAPNASSVATLFDEEARLYPAIQWLKDRKLRATQDPERHGPLFKGVTNALAKLLRDVESIDVYDDDVWVKAPLLGGDVPLSGLSDGYVTTVGWFIDIIARWAVSAEKREAKLGEEFYKEMTGVVLLDEIDMNLHPAWQRDVIRVLREDLFPRMTFVVTTHNPLTLLGARASEIWLLEREEGAITARRGHGRPELMTGSDLYEAYFNIASLFPVDLGEMIDRYSALARDPSRTEEDDARMDVLRAELVERGVEPAWEPVPRGASAT